MKRKTFLTILIGIVALAVIAVIAFLVISFWKGDGDNTTDSGFSLFPGRGGGNVVDQEPIDTPNQEDTPDVDISLNDQNIPRLRKLADFPVIALASFYTPETVAVERIVPVETTETDDETTEPLNQTTTETITEIVDINQLYARYIRHRDGSVFTSKIGNALEQKQTSLETIPYAGEAFVGNHGSSVVYRFFNENTGILETFLADIPENNIPDAVCAAPLPAAVTADSDENHIMLLQEFLNYTLEDDIVSDGIFGSGLQTALKNFQSVEGLPRTGKADTETITTINNRCLAILEEKARADVPIDLTGVFLAENITAMDTSPSSEQLVYFSEQENNTVGITLDFTDRSLEQIFVSPFSEWAPYWTGDTTITLTTKPSGAVEGYLYQLDTENKTLHKFIDEIRGLTGLANPQGSLVFASENTSAITSVLVNTQTGARRNLSLATLPEKCVWAQDGVILHCAVPNFLDRGLYPDDWYKGKISFTDSIWSINTATGETRRIIDLSREGNESFDVIHPNLDSNELYMFFINKQTMEPWILEL